MTLATASLLDRLPEVRGKLEPHAALAPYTWFRVGGPAEVLFRPADTADLAAFLKGCPRDVPLTVIGVGSNLLVRDGGVPGVVIRLGKAFAGIDVLDGCKVKAGAAALDVAVARAALDAGIAGLEFYRGIPGSIGGALRMNAGAYGGETKDALIELSAVDREGTIRTIPVSECGYSYRASTLAADLIFVEALYQGRPGDRAEIEKRMNEITASREETQPIRSRTGGSTFKNPEGHKSWQLIDAAGFRGRRQGDAEFSEKHCNFLINRGAATAADLEGLGEAARAAVKAQSGIDLHWEIRRIGVAA